MVKSRSKRKRKRQRVSARRRAETHKTGFEQTSLDVDRDVSFFALTKEGTRRIDVIPYVVGEGNPYAEPGDRHFERTYWTHPRIGPNQDTFVCPAKTAGKRCPICEHRAKLQRDPDADEKLIKDLLPKERQLWNVIDLEEPEKGVQLWDISFHLFGKLLDAEVKNADEDDDYEYFADLEDGFTLKLGVGEKSFAGNKFCEVETIGFKKRREQYDEEIVGQTQNLDEILKILDHDKLRAIFLQIDEGEESEQVEPDVDEPDADEIPTADGMGLKKGMTVETEEFGKCEIVRISKDGTSLTLEDEDGGVHKAVGCDDVVPGAEEPEPKPKKSKAGRKPKAEPEPEPDDDWDEEDEEEEKPEPKKKAKSSKSKKKAETDEEEDDNWDGDWDEDDD